MSGKPKIKDIESTIKNMDIIAAVEYLYSIREQYQMPMEKLIAKYEKKKDAFEKEVFRYSEMCKYEKNALKQGFKLVAGVDEAGRGPLAGPVVAAAVILPDNIFIEKLNDSKQLSSNQRDKLFDVIKEKAISYGIGIADEKCIDDINILNATKLAMKTAVKNMSVSPDILLTDAVKLDDLEIKQIPIVKGDCLSVSIAAASILAKVTRDRMIEEMDTKYPQYGFSKHKGYGTKEHIEAIKKFGICPIHRVSFTKNFTS